MIPIVNNLGNIEPFHRGGPVCQTGSPGASAVQGAMQRIGSPRIGRRLARHACSLERPARNMAFPPGQ